ncbi:hypothetical protein [Tamlana crocina]|uniref:DUF4878 domain-containing protein n=1 Tax=Tamlana crocina TaxID=393006 RepID=A0ABX1DE10_9FLAO|nr:hypothetical protein [Tamlana crocina]NJX16586.1 hypothetical protein [Tamlana crocina]
MRLKHIIILFILISINSSCNYQKSSQELEDIYNLVIDKTVKPLPPPPPKPGDNSSMSQKLRDSLRSIKLNIAISNRLELYNIQSFNISDYKNYQSAKENLIANNNEILMMKNWLKTDKGHKIKVISEKESNKKELFKKYRAIISLSNIGFNQAKNKAITIVRVSYAPKLSGTAILYLLEKINGKWKIEYEKVIEIS